jgi:NAD(P)-dependent dehydrogenase (short-subunit alcohol dehydrogenase family)
MGGSTTQDALCDAKDATVAVVTGGTRGIGRAIVERLLRDGASVVFCGRGPEQVQRAQEELAEQFGEVRVTGVVADVSARSDVQRIFDTALGRYGQLDVAIANAGMDCGAPFLQIDDTEFEQVFAINVRGAFFTAQIAARSMLSRSCGAIVLVASTNAYFVESNLAAYNASKGAVVALMRSAALELAPHGITVNAVGPGLVHTDATQALVDSEHAPAYLARIPAGRFGRVSDVAGAVVFLASKDARWLTGHHLIVDGGQTVGIDLPLDTVAKWTSP